VQDILPNRVLEAGHCAGSSRAVCATHIRRVYSSAAHGWLAKNKRTQVNQVPPSIGSRILCHLLLLRRRHLPLGVHLIPLLLQPTRHWVRIYYLCFAPSPCLMVSLQLLVAAQKSCRFEASRCCASSTTLDTGSSDCAHRGHKRGRQARREREVVKIGSGATACTATQRCLLTTASTLPQKSCHHTPQACLVRQHLRLLLFRTNPPRASQAAGGRRSCSLGVAAA
jgi:hypothetical protein